MKAGGRYYNESWQGCICPMSNCAKEGELSSGAVTPASQVSCCDGLNGYSIYPKGWVGGGLLCYNSTKGTPVCNNTGTALEGWYYSSTGIMLKLGKCETGQNKECNISVDCEAINKTKYNCTGQWNCMANKCTWSCRPVMRNCSSCNDGTSCGEKNQKNMKCTCSDYNDDGRNESCILSMLRPICEKCSDGTKCNETNNNGLTCDCTDIDGGGDYNFCYLKYTGPKECQSCQDNTTCGLRSSRGEICECRDLDGDSKPELCRLAKLSPGRRFCESCTDGTACGKINTDDRECVCLDIDEDETNEMCRLMKAASNDTQATYTLPEFIDRLISWLK